MHGARYNARTRTGRRVFRSRICAPRNDTRTDIVSSLLPSAIPVIETDRLILRAHRHADFADCLAMWADPQITRFIGAKPSSPAETWSKMLRYAGLWGLLGYGYWAIEEKATRRFVGELGFADFKRDLQPSIDGLPELGWAIVSACHRRGYATEAVHAALDWGDRHFAGRPTVCIIGPLNVASLRVAEKAGFVAFAQTTYSGKPIVIFRR